MNKKSEMNNIEVAVRIRNLNEHEIKKGSTASHIYDDAVSSWTVLNDKNAVVQTANTGNPLPAKKGRTYFNYTKTFDGEASNGQVYDGICQKTVSALVQGINGTIIAYGQTGSGKSHTMQGGNSSETGMIHMAALDIFNQIESCPQRTFVVCVSMFELYNQEINDLLSNETISSLQDPKTRMLVDASEEIVADYASFVNLFDSCNEGRKLRNTGMNKKSSRSHTIYRITVESRPVTDSSKEPLNDDKMCRSTLYLVDLAGSDTSKGTMTKKSNMLNSNQKEEKKLQLEANHINKSLLALSNVVIGLSRKTFVNFRNSILTRILQPFLEGQARVVMICCASPSGLYTECTRKTLELALYANQIKNKPRINYISSPTPLPTTTSPKMLGMKKSTASPKSSGVKKSTSSSKPRGVKTSTASPNSTGVKKSTASPRSIGKKTSTASPKSTGVKKPIASPRSTGVKTSTASRKPAGVKKSTSSPKSTGIKKSTASPRSLVTRSSPSSHDLASSSVGNSRPNPTAKKHQVINEKISKKNLTVEIEECPQIIIDEIEIAAVTTPVDNKMSQIEEEWSWIKNSYEYLSEPTLHRNIGKDQLLDTESEGKDDSDAINTNSIDSGSTAMDLLLLAENDDTLSKASEDTNLCSETDDNGRTSTAEAHVKIPGRLIISDSQSPDMQISLDNPNAQSAAEQSLKIEEQWDSIKSYYASLSKDPLSDNIVEENERTKTNVEHKSASEEKANNLKATSATNASFFTDEDDTLSFSSSDSEDLDLNGNIHYNQKYEPKSSALQNSERQIESVKATVKPTENATSKVEEQEESITKDYTEVSHSTEKNSIIQGDYADRISKVNEVVAFWKKESVSKKIANSDLVKESVSITNESQVIDINGDCSEKLETTLDSTTGLSSSPSDESDGDKKNTQPVNSDMEDPITQQNESNGSSHYKIDRNEEILQRGGEKDDAKIEIMMKKITPTDDAPLNMYAMDYDKEILSNDSVSLSSESPITSFCDDSEDDNSSCEPAPKSSSDLVFQMQPEQPYDPVREVLDFGLDHSSQLQPIDEHDDLDEEIHEDLDEEIHDELPLTSDVIDEKRELLGEDSGIGNSSLHIQKEAVTIDVTMIAPTSFSDSSDNRKKDTNKIALSSPASIQNKNDDTCEITPIHSNDNRAETDVKFSYSDDSMTAFSGDSMEEEFIEEYQRECASQNNVIVSRQEGKIIYNQKLDNESTLKDLENSIDLENSLPSLIAGQDLEDSSTILGQDFEDSSTILGQYFEDSSTVTGQYFGASNKSNEDPKTTEEEANEETSYSSLRGSNSDGISEIGSFSIVSHVSQQKANKLESEMSKLREENKVLMEMITMVREKRDSGDQEQNLLEGGSVQEHDSMMDLKRKKRQKTENSEPEHDEDENIDHNNSSLDINPLLSQETGNEVEKEVQNNTHRLKEDHNVLLEKRIEQDNVSSSNFSPLNFNEARKVSDKRLNSSNPCSVDVESPLREEIIVMNRMQQLQEMFGKPTLKFEKEGNKENSAQHRRSVIENRLQDSIITFEKKMTSTMKQEEAILLRWENLSIDFRSYRKKWAHKLQNKREPEFSFELD